MESKTAAQILQNKIDAYNNRGVSDFTIENSIYKMRFADDERTFIHSAMQEFSNQQNTKLREALLIAWSYKDERYMTNANAVFIQQILRETEL